MSEEQHQQRAGKQQSHQVRPKVDSLALTRTWRRWRDRTFGLSDRLQRTAHAEVAADERYRSGRLGDEALPQALEVLKEVKSSWLRDEMVKRLVDGH
jgi:hypothetical protein